MTAGCLASTNEVKLLIMYEGVRVAGILTSLGLWNTCELRVLNIA